MAQGLPNKEKEVCRLPVSCRVYIGDAAPHTLTTACPQEATPGAELVSTEVGSVRHRRRQWKSIRRLIDLTGFAYKTLRGTTTLLETNLNADWRHLKTFTKFNYVNFTFKFFNIFNVQRYCTENVCLGVGDCHESSGEVWNNIEQFYEIFTLFGLSFLALCVKN